MKSFHSLPYIVRTSKQTQTASRPPHLHKNTYMSPAVVLSPVIMYGIFNLYRDRVNPRMKFSDFLFIVAGVAVVANLVSHVLTLFSH